MWKKLLVFCWGMIHSIRNVRQIGRRKARFWGSVANTYNVRLRQMMRMALCIQTKLQRKASAAK
jgi:hypothetical protein